MGTSSERICQFKIIKYKRSGWSKDRFPTKDRFNKVCESGGSKITSMKFQSINTSIVTNRHRRSKSTRQTKLASELILCCEKVSHRKDALLVVFHAWNNQGSSFGSNSTKYKNKTFKDRRKDIEFVRVWAFLIPAGHWHDFGSLSGNRFHWLLLQSVAFVNYGIRLRTNKWSSLRCFFACINGCLQSGLAGKGHYLPIWWNNFKEKR